MFLYLYFWHGNSLAVMDEGPMESQPYHSYINEIVDHRVQIPIILFQGIVFCTQCCLNLAEQNMGRSPGKVSTPFMP